MLGVGGYLSGLRRTFIGDFRVEDSIALEEVQGSGVERYLRPA
jgi:tRNA U55 pseudouridine synthase TruB